MIEKTEFRMWGQVRRCLPSSTVDYFSEHFPSSGCEKKNPLVFRMEMSPLYFLCQRVDIAGFSQTGTQRTSCLLQVHSDV